MKLTKRSIFSGKENTIDLPISEEQYALCEQRYENGELIQNAFSCLSPEHREFVLTGVTPDEWNATFGDDEDDDE